MLRSIISFVFIGFSGLTVAQPAVSTDTASDPRAVILIIGDGFDDQHVTMGRNFLAGHDG